MNKALLSRITALFFLCLSLQYAYPMDTPVSTPAEAQAFLNTVTLPDSSIYWPHVRSRLFIENLRSNILSPLAMYQGSNTNFCGYAALSYLPLHDDPLQYVRFMTSLYKDGRANWGATVFDPSTEVKNAAGSLRFKGILDIHPADQMWFLILADHFRSYLNFFQCKFRNGSENTFWAACNLGKFNRIIHHLLGYRINAIGSDLLRPTIKDLYAYLSNALKTGTTFLYVNNTYLHKKNHDKRRFSFPTHYLVLNEIRKTNDLFTIIYWDYGGRTLREVSPAFLKKILYGVTYVTKSPQQQPSAHEN